MGPIKGQAVILGRRAQGRSCAGITEGLAWPLHSAGEPEGIDLTGGAAVSATSEASDTGSARAAWVGRVAGAGPGDAGAGSAGASVGRRERNGACWAGACGMGRSERGKGESSRAAPRREGSWAAGFAGPGEEGKAGPAWEKGCAGVWAGLGWFQGVGLFSFYFSFSISKTNKHV